MVPHKLHRPTCWWDPLKWSRSAVSFPQGPYILGHSQTKKRDILWSNTTCPWFLAELTIERRMLQVPKDVICMGYAPNVHLWGVSILEQGHLALPTGCEDILLVNVNLVVKATDLFGAWCFHLFTWEDFFRCNGSFSSCDIRQIRSNRYKSRCIKQK